MVAMAHPNLFAPVSEPIIKDGQLVCAWRHKGAAKFSRAVAAFDLTTQTMHHHLLAVAYPKDRHAQIKHTHWRHRRTFRKNGSWPAREDDGPWRKGRKKGIIHFVKRMDFAIDIQLSQAARDKLRDLRTKVDDQKAVMGWRFHAK